jgi:hypothetical protein
LLVVVEEEQPVTVVMPQAAVELVVIELQLVFQ